MTPREELAWLYRELGACGLNVGSAGNVSARTEEGMLITPTGIGGDAVTPEDLVACTLDGAHEGARAPSSEWAMHAVLYRTTDSGVVVHAHADAATALACLNLPLPAFHYAVAEFGGDDVRCAPYVTFGTSELADAAAAAMRDRSACLLANHGLLCRGRDARTALLAALKLETLCRQYLLARAAGNPRLLTRAEMDAARRRYATYGNA